MLALTARPVKHVWSHTCDVQEVQAGIASDALAQGGQVQTLQHRKTTAHQQVSMSDIHAAYTRHETSEMLAAGLVCQLLSLHRTKAHKQSTKQYYKAFSGSIVWVRVYSRSYQQGQLCHTEC